MHWVACGQAEQDTDEDTTLTHNGRQTEEVESKPVDITEYVFQRNSNKYPQNYFRNPFDSTIYLAGTFCELRNNHFHGGIDIRTGGWEGWEVRAVADGYVSRIKVSPYGYGKAIYITHPNGYTSVYGHLKNYSGAINTYIKEAQYKQRSYEIEVFPSAKELPVKKGQIIAISGNTGGSGGPHLHFEIRDAAGQSVNPLLFGLDIKDNIEPQINQVLVYLRDKSIYTEKGGYPMKKLKRGTPYLQNTALVVQPGTYAFGMLAKDYFTDTRNRLGVNYCWLTANGELLFQYQIERMNFDLGRNYNTHIDYYLKSKTGVNYVRLFKESFNPYPYYKQNHNGEVLLHHGDSVRFKLFVEDVAGMKDSVGWFMIADSTGQKIHWIDGNASDTSFRVVAGRNNTFSYNNWTVSLPSSSFYHSFDMLMKAKAIRPKALSSSMQIHYGYTPLHSHITVSTRPSKEALNYGDKLCAVSFNGASMVYEGGTLNNGILSFQTRSFGEYALYYDDTPPRIRAESVGKRFMFRVSDNLSGIASYAASIDDKWILMEYEPKTSAMFGEVPNWIKPGKHVLKLVVLDERGNKSTFERTITL